jgi:hypothetical protein
MIQLDVLAIGARLVVGITLIVAAHAKLHDLHAFAEGVHDYGVLPPSPRSPSPDWCRGSSWRWASACW